MKTEILNKQENKGIDWDKPQWLMCDDFLVFTTGKHTSDCFCGTLLPCADYPEGAFITSFDKARYKPIPKEGLTIKITNE